jgi:membrane protease YdiL (CAAX protease family)
LTKIQGSLGSNNYLIAYFALAITPAICEEILFRGLILSALLKKFSPSISIIVSAGLFAAFHMDLYRFLPTMVLGLLLGWIVYKTRSIFLSILFHFMNNALSVLLMFKDEWSRALDKLFVGWFNILIVMVAALLLVAAGNYMISRKQSV